MRAVRLVALLFASFLSIPLLADTCRQQVLAGYAQSPTEYRASIEGFSVQMKRITRPVESNYWEVEHQASALIASLRETSRFSVNSQGLSTQRYEYDQTGIKKRFWFAEVSGGQLTINRGDTERQLTLGTPVFDTISHLIQLQLERACSEGDATQIYELPVIRKSSVKPYRYAFVDEQVLTLSGERLIQTELWERVDGDEVNRVWIAPELGYQMVKYAKRDGDKLTELLIR